MCLWSREQIAACLPAMAQFLERRSSCAEPQASAPRESGRVLRQGHGYEHGR